MIIDTNILRKEICKQHGQAVIGGKKNANDTFKTVLAILEDFEDFAQDYPTSIQPVKTSG